MKSPCSCHGYTLQVQVLHVFQVEETSYDRVELLQGRWRCFHCSWTVEYWRPPPPRGPWLIAAQIGGLARYAAGASMYLQVVLKVQQKDTVRSFHKIRSKTSLRILCTIRTSRNKHWLTHPNLVCAQKIVYVMRLIILMTLTLLIIRKLHIKNLVYALHRKYTDCSSRIIRSEIEQKSLRKSITYDKNITHNTQKKRIWG